MGKITAYKVNNLSKVDLRFYKDGDHFITPQSVGMLTNGKMKILQSDLMTELNDLKNRVKALEEVVDSNLALEDDPEAPDRNYITSGGGTSVVEYDPEQEGFYTNTHRARDFKHLLKKGSYTISLDAKKRPEGNATYAILTENIGGKSFIQPGSLTDNWQRFSVTFTVEDETLTRKLIFYDTLFWKNIKLEKGTKATDRTLAP